MASQILGTVLKSQFTTSAARHGAGAGAGRGHGSMKMWKAISLFVAMPAIGITMLSAYEGEMEHLSHPRAKFIAYEHLRIRTKPFPWGDGNKTLFHHPHYNALPDGYEDEGEGEGEEGEGEEEEEEEEED